MRRLCILLVGFCAAMTAACGAMMQTGGAAPGAEEGVPAQPFQVGDRVSCDWRGGGTRYTGKVAELRAGGRIFVHYDDGDVEETSPEMCSALGDADVRDRPVIATGDGLSGTYAIVSAANPAGGASYTGTVNITKLGDAYRLDWTIPNSPPYSGVGIEMNGVLAVGWGVGGTPGVVVYEVKGGDLRGRWASLGAQGPLGIEDLNGPAGLSGTYQIAHARNPAGGSYTGSVALSQTGNTHALVWTLPRESYTGVGILLRDVLSVGWGPGTGVVAYEIRGTRLEGVWADARGGALGKEILERR